MKTCIVKASTLAKYGRWDAGFYTGMIEHKTAQEQIERAEAALKAAQTRLANARKAKAESEKRVQGMIEAGEIVPLD